MMLFFESLNLQWEDLLDVALLTTIFYRILLLIKGTRAIPMLMGFALLLALYMVSRLLQLEAIGMLLDTLAKSIVLVLVVLFQSDIRNALAQFGLVALFRDSSGELKKDIVDHSLQACMIMARQRIGALIVFERDVGLRNFIERGTPIDGVLSEGVLLSIFHPTSPLHDGAVIVTRKGRIGSARSILPVSMNSKLSPVLGTRHRAAIGLTEETDAVVLVVSEERSQISLCFKGELIKESRENIKQVLFDLLVGKTSGALEVNSEHKIEQNQDSESRSSSSEPIATESTV
ncbi:diadenylate cyclase CdaA [Deltaproteobacteria bacterium TL4]